MSLRCVALLLLVSVSFQGVEAAISVAVTPLVEVELGSPLVIPCTVTSSVGEEVVTQWFIISQSSRTRISYRDARLFVADLGTGYESRIDARRSDSALALNATETADERDFVCQVVAGRASVAEATASVRVFSAPTVAVTASQRPVLLKPQHHHKIGECYVRNAYPEPLVTWYKDSLPLWPSPDVKVTGTVATESDGTFAVTSALSYQLQRWDVGAGYRCVVNYTVPGGRSEAVASETIYVTVHYPPRRVALILESPRAAVMEGDTVVLRCRADGFPPPEVDFYMSSPTRVDYGHATAGDALTLPAVTRGHSGTYGCRVRSGNGVHGRLSGSVDLLVHYAHHHGEPSSTVAATTRLPAGAVVQAASSPSPSSPPPPPSPSVSTGLGRSRPVKVAAEGGAEKAELSARGLPWFAIIVLPLFVVLSIWAILYACSKESQEERFGAGGGEAALSRAWTLTVRCCCCCCPEPRAAQPLTELYGR
ncbi:basal cell adhesion molecule-like [Lethenteron reissneri]|uniref:basal cell adhesion molecule-like n=3 Tax=Lethenteron reissneri TaxID=7753 RepID=UPI002AB76A12|nr:basal cell adhesion molecule-like [Lethenteron reissneri]